MKFKGETSVIRGFFVSSIIINSKNEENEMVNISLNPNPELTYSSRMGVSEAQVRSLNQAKTIIGTVDDNGDNYGIVNVKGRVFNKLPTILMFVFLVPVLAGYFIQSPFAWLPDWSYSDWYQTVKHYQLFTLTSWVMTVISYLLLMFCIILKNNYYSGVEGAYIVFMRYGKIVQILSPGEFKINFDWRITPEYVVSSKLFVLNMPNVEGKEKNNHTIQHAGSFLAQMATASDAHKLISMGGFKNFIQALSPMYSTSIKDMFKTTSADNFNTFLIEPINGASDLIDNSGELDQMTRQNLSIDLIEKLSGISEVDVSKIDLSENGGVRDVLLPALKNAAAAYGITLGAYVPTANNVSPEFLGTKVIGIVTGLERLKQAAGTLYDIIDEELDEDIQGEVAGKKVGALKIKKIIDEMQALMEAMMDKSNVDMIIGQKSEAIKNVVAGHIGIYLSKIETLQQKINAKSVDMTGLELYVTELESMIESLNKEGAIRKLVPAIKTVYVSGMDKESLLPSVDSIENMLDLTGLKKVFDELKNSLSKEGEVAGSLEAIDLEIGKLREEASNINITEIIEALQAKLNAVSGDSGIDISAFTWNNVKQRIAEIKEDAGIEDEVEDDQIEESQIAIAVQ